MRRGSSLQLRIYSSRLDFAGEAWARDSHLLGATPQRDAITNAEIPKQGQIQALTNCKWNDAVLKNIHFVVLIHSRLFRNTELLMMSVIHSLPRDTIHTYTHHL